MADFRKRLVGYLKDIFGIEIQETREGEKYDSKTMQALKTEETKNEFLDYKIKQIYSPGFKINEKLFDYYKKWFTEEAQKLNKKWKGLENSVSRQEFDKITDQDQDWLKKHTFAKSIMPIKVVIYRLKA
jgi:predicted nuclease with TOPRIM domain